MTNTLDREKNAMTPTEKNGMTSPKFDSKTLKRLFSYMKEYRGMMILVVVCILLSALASAISSMFLQTLIDDYITPLLGDENPVFDGLIRVLITLGGIYAIGTLAT